MKTCPKCNNDFPVSEFYRRKTGTRTGQYYEKCKDCMRKRGRSYYRDNHTSQLKLALIRRRKAYNKKREFLIKLKDRACADCKNRFPFYVMDFDHLDKKTKINNVSYMFTRNWSLDRIQLEVGKCQVVCANCHRIRTYKNLDRRNAEVAKVVTAGA